MRIRDDFLEATRPGDLAKLLKRASADTAAGPCGWPLLAEPVPSLTLPGKWPDMGTAEAAEKRHRLYKKIKKEMMAALYAVIPRQVIIKPSEPFIDSSIVKFGDAVSNGHAHIDDDDEGGVVDSHYKFTATAAFPNSTLFFPDAKAKAFSFDTAGNGRIMAPPPGQLVIWNDNRQIHAAPGNDRTPDEWRETMKPYGGFDKWLLPDGSLRRLFCRIIFDVEEDWAERKIAEATGRPSRPYALEIAGRNGLEI